MLRAEAPALAAKFDMFTRLAREEGQPPAEEQLRPDGAWRYAAFSRHRTRLRCYAVLAAMLVSIAVILAAELA